MFNNDQKRLVARLISDSRSSFLGSEGKGVAVFVSDEDLPKVLDLNGFTQDIRKDKFNTYYGHSLWWNEECQILVSNAPGCKKWTVANQEDPLFSHEI